MKRIYVIEPLCNGCRLCQLFCSSLEAGIFSEDARIRVLKTPGEERDIPILDCSGICQRPIDEPGQPTCVSVCPTGALFYTDPEGAAQRHLEWEKARRVHSLFKVIAPWKWPLPWDRDTAETTPDGQESCS